MGSKLKELVKVCNDHYLKCPYNYGGKTAMAFQYLMAGSLFAAHNFTGQGFYLANLYMIVSTLYYSYNYPRTSTWNSYLKKRNIKSTRKNKINIKRAFLTMGLMGGYYLINRKNVDLTLSAFFEDNVYNQIQNTNGNIVKLLQYQCKTLVNATLYLAIGSVLYNSLSKATKKNYSATFSKRGLDAMTLSTDCDLEKKEKISKEYISKMRAHVVGSMSLEYYNIGKIEKSLDYFCIENFKNEDEYVPNTKQVSKMLMVADIIEKKSNIEQFIISAVYGLEKEIPEHFALKSIDDILLENSYSPEKKSSMISSIGIYLSHINSEHSNTVWKHVVDELKKSNFKTDTLNQGTTGSAKVIKTLEDTTSISYLTILRHRDIKEKESVYAEYINNKFLNEKLKGSENAVPNMLGYGDDATNAWNISLMERGEEFYDFVKKQGLTKDKITAYEKALDFCSQIQKYLTDDLTHESKRIIYGKLDLKKKFILDSPLVQGGAFDYRLIESIINSVLNKEYKWQTGIDFHPGNLRLTEKKVLLNDVNEGNKAFFEKDTEPQYTQGLVKIDTDKTCKVPPWEEIILIEQSNELLLPKEKIILRDKVSKSIGGYDNYANLLMLRNLAYIKANQSANTEKKHIEYYINNALDFYKSNTFTTDVQDSVTEFSSSLDHLLGKL